MNTNSKNPFLLLAKYRSALMGFAALWIFIFHDWAPVLTGYGRLAAIERFIRKTGFCGVDIFLFLSGIGMTYSIAKTERLLSFYYKRIKRIILPFIFVAAVRSCLEGWSQIEFWKKISGISFYRESIYAFLWFVPAILTFYLLFPLYYRLLTKSSNKIMFTACVLTLWLIWSIGVRDIMREDLYGFTNRIPIFIIGVLAGWLDQNKEVVFDRMTWGFIACLFALGIYLSYLSNYQDMYILVPVSNCCVPNILMSISLSFLLPQFFHILNEKRYIRPVGKKLVRFFTFYGSFTLELYCLQEWAEKLIRPQMSGVCGDLTINVVLLAIITIAALMISLISKHIWSFADRIVVKSS